ncbi:MAG: metallophosphoesterase [Clostridia bacterium]|nr:metallophosphoesterase [Clostridia bacterium]
MKIIHTGDIHIGSVLHNLPSDKASLRKAEILDGFRRICAYAKDNGVTAVLIVGDLFEENEIASDLKKEVFTAIEQAKPVLFFYVTGNHDIGISLGQTPENFLRFSQNKGWASYALGENITVTGLDAEYFSAHNFSALSLSPDNYNIVLLHGDIQGKQGGKDTLPAQYLQNKYIDYLALGHIHTPDAVAKRLDARGRYRYCGCPEGRGFDETGKKGFFLLEIERGALIDEKFYTFARREAVEKRVDISACNGYADIEAAALTALQNERKENVIKLVLCGTYKEGMRKDTRLLASRLCERFFHVKVVDESRLYIDSNSYMNDCTERGEFIREIAKYNIDPLLKEEILEVGLKALAGEEIEL